MKKKLKGRLCWLQRRLNKENVKPISEFGTITMKMISSAINNGREQTKIGSINIRVVPPAPQRFFCQRPMVMSVTVGRLKWQADEVPV